MSPVAAAKPLRTASPLPSGSMVGIGGRRGSRGVWWIRRMSRAPRAGDRRSMRSTVPSVEWPSTNRISVWRPISGSRSTASSTLPRSLRHGITTDEKLGFSERHRPPPLRLGARRTGRGRNGFRPGARAGDRGSATLERRGTRAGQELPCPRATSSKPDELEEVLEVLHAEPVLVGLRHLPAEPLGRGRGALPQEVVVGHDEPRPRVADGVQRARSVA